MAADKEPLFCPMCRMSMKEIKSIMKELESVSCPVCENSFSFVKGNPPYKCAFCNNTFKIVPFRIQEEKL